MYLFSFLWNRMGGCQVSFRPGICMFLFRYWIALITHMLTASARNRTLNLLECIEESVVMLFNCLHFATQKNEFTSFNANHIKIAFIWNGFYHLMFEHSERLEENLKALDNKISATDSKVQNRCWISKVVVVHKHQIFIPKKAAISLLIHDSLWSVRGHW